VLSTTSSVSNEAGPVEQNVNESDYEQENDQTEESSIGQMLPSNKLTNGE
jgi:hypothetical protein